MGASLLAGTMIISKEGKLVPHGKGPARGTGGIGPAKPRGEKARREVSSNTVLAKVKKTKVNVLVSARQASPLLKSAMNSPDATFVNDRSYGQLGDSTELSDSEGANGHGGHGGHLNRPVKLGLSLKERRRRAAIKEERKKALFAVTHDISSVHTTNCMADLINSI